MKRFHFVGVGLLFAMSGWLAACSIANRNGSAVSQATPVVITVEVTRLVTVEVPVDGTRPAAVGTPAPAVTPPPTPTLLPTPSEVGKPGDFTPDDLNMLFDVWSLVEKQYDGNLPTDTALRDTIITAAIDLLGDRFTHYYPAEAAERIREGFRGDFEGIGAFVGTNDEGQFYIARPIPNTPAAEAGLKPDDIVLSVDGQDITGWSTDEVIAIVRGPAGEAVTLSIQRAGVAEPFDVTIVRARIQVPVVESRLLEDNIGYVQLVSFNQLASDQLESAIQTLMDEGATSLIFDLRYNGGGLLTQAVSVGDIFLPDGIVVIERDRNGAEQVYRTDDGDIAETIPLVVLINEESASASELVSAAIQDRQRATLIGTHSFGKGSVQTPNILSDGSEVRITIARFYSPTNRVIDHVGVTPDIIVEGSPEQLGGEDDVQLQRAVQFLQTGQ